MMIMNDVEEAILYLIYENVSYFSIYQFTLNFEEALS